MIRGAWLGALVAIAAACATPATAPSVVAPSPPLLLAPCHAPRSTVEARCGTLEVFEDRAARAGRTIPIKVVVSRRESRGSSVRCASGGTSCSWTSAGAQASFADLLPPDRIRACRQALERIADLRLYTTPIAMDDVDDVRAALGSSTANLYGLSYASLAALQYLRQHPARVRSLALSGVATPAQKRPLHFAAGAQAALDRLIADCAADEPCHRACPDLARDLAGVLARFDAGPATFELPRTEGETAERVSMSRMVFAERLRLMLYNLRGGSRVPLVLHRAAQGDWVPFARATSPSLTGAGPAFAMGMYLSVTCSESIPVIREDDIARATRGSFVGEDRVRAHVRACTEWPRGTVPAAWTRCAARRSSRADRPGIASWQPRARILW